MSRAFVTRLVWGAATLVTAIAAHAVPSPVAVYTFNDSFASSVGGAPALTLTDPLGRSGFATDTVFGNSVRVFNFVGTQANEQQAGLTLNTSGLLPSDFYSVEIVFKFTERDNAWRRIVDVQNRQSDNGFYVDPANRLDIYPVAGGDAFTNNVYHDVFLVNDHGVVSFYLDGGPKTTVTTTVMTIDANNRMGFFLDNVVAGGQQEYSSGSVSLIRLYDQALDAPPPPIPEPSVYALMMAGLGIVLVAARRRG